jgi:hypothetical protein
VTTDPSKVPNPGSDLALAAGCTCPIADNNRGKIVPWPGSWWISAGCPLHDTPPVNDE